MQPAWDALPKLVAQPLMFLLVVIGWVFFRATDFGMAGDLLLQMFSPVASQSALDLGILGSMVLLAGAWAMAGPNAHDLHGENWRMNGKPGHCRWAFGGSRGTLGRLVAVGDPVARLPVRRRLADQ
jgi:hypothetical protein